MSTSYKMPVPYRGQTVLWYEGGVRNEDRATPAVVLVESHSSLRLRVLGFDGTFDKECVRHLDDPIAKEYDKINEGGWDFCSPDKAKSAAAEINVKAK